MLFQCFDVHKIAFSKKGGIITKSSWKGEGMAFKRVENNCSKWMSFNSNDITRICQSTLSINLSAL